jgi:hypothetical protein
MLVLAVPAFVIVGLATAKGPVAGIVAVGLLLCSQYWLGPVLIWVTNRSRVPRWDRPSSSGATLLPALTRPFFESTDRAFVELGFAHAATLREENLAPGFVTWVTLYFNRSLRERAVAHAHVPVNPRAALIRPKESFYFVTSFMDGSMVETANSDHVSPFPRVPGMDSRQFPDVSDARLLHRLHTLRSSALGDRPRELPAEGEEVAYLTKAMAAFYETHVGTGYLRVVEPGYLYRPTVKGAFLMTWKLLPPMTWIARDRRARLNRSFLAEQPSTTGRG